MLITIIFIVLAATAVCFILALFVNGLRFLLQKRDRPKARRRLWKTTLFAAGACTLCATLVWGTQIFAFTPAIHDETGAPLKNSIAELRQVTLNGRNEWISLRGKSKNNPVLLFLAGGPGGTQMAAVRHDLSMLEENFVVVNWDQPGSGKSFDAAGLGTITPETYIDDGYALTKYLCETFEQEKIYLVGESWGSALGIFMADKAPELYHAFIGTGQMVDFLETEHRDYRLAMDIARERGDSKTVDALEANGPPPYTGGDVTWKSAVYLQYLSAYMSNNPAILNGGYNTFRDLFSSEYGIIDKINFLRGIAETFNRVYPQLYGIDLREAVVKLKIPVYFFIGRHDINAPTDLTEAYFNLLEAPKKELIWFESSGHSPWINESERFAEALLRVMRTAEETAAAP